MAMRAAATSPVSEPSLRMSTRSLAEMLPRTLPSTTTSRAVMFAATWPLRPTVTRLPGRLMAPSILPSTKRDSEPVTSPLMTSDLPMVACSPLAAAAAGAAGREASNEPGVETGGVGRAGSGVAGEEGPVWFGFHMGRFCSFRGGAWEICLRFVMAGPAVTSHFRADRYVGSNNQGNCGQSGAPFSVTILLRLGMGKRRPLKNERGIERVIGVVAMAGDVYGNLHKHWCRELDTAKSLAFAGAAR